MDCKKEKYEQALKRAKAIIDVAANKEEAEGYIYTIFPELKESENEKMFKAVMCSLDKDKLQRVWSVTEADVKTWIVSLKDRIQPKQEWSEYDKEMLQDIIDAIPDNYAASDYHEMVDWLKSLRPQTTWKPSDEQMVALDCICSYIRNKADWEISQDMISDLYKLSEQLKKLREK